MPIPLAVYDREMYDPYDVGIDYIAVKNIPGTRPVVVGTYTEDDPALKQAGGPDVEVLDWKTARRRYIFNPMEPQPAE